MDHFIKENFVKAWTDMIMHLNDKMSKCQIGKLRCMYSVISVNKVGLITC